MLKRCLTLLMVTIMLIGETHEIPRLWNAFKVSNAFSEKYTIAFENDFRTYNLGEEMYYYHGDIGISFSVFNSYKLNVNFREVFELKSGVWKKEHRPHVTLSNKMKIGNFSFSGRTRIEFRIKQDQESVVRSRNMVTVKYNQSFTKLKIVPYIADEIFADSEKNKINRNRFYLGIKMNGFSFGKPTLYFMQQRDLKNDVWEGRNILGIKLAF